MQQADDDGQTFQDDAGQRVSPGDAVRVCVQYDGDGESIRHWLPGFVYRGPAAIGAVLVETVGEQTVAPIEAVRKADAA